MTAEVSLWEGEWVDPEIHLYFCYSIIDSLAGWDTVACLNGACYGHPCNHLHYTTWFHTTGRNHFP
jgi:hypothetical protein